MISKGILAIPSSLPKLNPKWVGLAKWTVAIIFFVYAFRSGLISMVGSTVFDLRLLSIGISLQFMIVFVQALRWKSLNDSQGIVLSLKDTFSIGMISHFFALFAGGTMGSDVVRGLYLSHHTPTGRKLRPVVSILLDRGIGLTLMVVGAVFGLAMKHGVFSSELPIGKAASLAAQWLPVFLFLFFLGLASATYFFGRRAPWVALLSLITMTTSVLWAHEIGRSLQSTVGIFDFFFISQIVTVVSAIPFLPLGIGVGQIAYYHLFELVGAPGSQGASLCTILQAQMVAFNLLGALFYVSKKKKTGINTPP